MIKFARAVQRLSRVINMIGVAFLMPMMFLTTVDVILRYFFNRPIKGGMEYSEVMMVIIIWLGFSYTLQVEGHVKIELFVSRLSKNTQIYFDIFACLIGLTLTGLLNWFGYMLTLNSYLNGEEMDVTSLPLYPFKGLIWAASILFTLEILAELSLNILKLRGKKIQAAKED